MKMPLNDHQPSPDWVEQALHAHLTAMSSRASVEASSPEFRGRCRAAASGALDVLKMQQLRPRVASVPGSLREHFETLAHLAGVRLEPVFQTLRINRADPPDSDSARGLATLARHLGLARAEAMLRLRCGFALLAGAVGAAEWPGTMQPIRARLSAGAKKRSGNLDQALCRREAGYTASRRAKLRNALNAVAEVYEQDTI